MLLHSQGSTTNNPHLTEWGAVGVDLFFAISGILICSRLLEEERATGTLSLGKFYIRRIFRIQPAAYAFLLVCLLLEVSHLLPVDLPGLVTSVFMVRNYYYWIGSSGRDAWYTAHFWSLSVEEHFYLLLPGLLYFVRKRRALSLGLLAMLFGGWRLFVEHSTLWHAKGMWLNTEMRLHSLLIPALGAVLVTRSGPRTWMLRWLIPWRAMTFLLAAGIGLHLAGWHGLLWPLIIPVCFPLLVLSTLLHPQRTMSRLLELEPLRYVGRLSYSLYLWQMLFFRSGQPLAPPLRLFQTFPCNYVVLITCALASYYLVERPMIAVGHRLAPLAIPSIETAYARSTLAELVLPMIGD